jgi:hypothetical protein
MQREQASSRRAEAPYITIVSGLPRSGTSMMMRMLEAGGMDVVTDQLRRPDEDNPNGYYEFEKVKKIKEDDAWLPQAYNKVFKMVSMLLSDLPRHHQYKVIFMKRNMQEVLLSQKKMLDRNAKEVGVEDNKMADLFNSHLKSTYNWLQKQDHIETLYVNYNEMIREPNRNVQLIIDFLEQPLDSARMISIVDRNLYRNIAS